MIVVQNVSKTFPGRSGDVEALKNVSIQVDDGDIFGVVGFSGAGKSTLIRTVNLLERPDSGKVIIDGIDVTDLPKRKLRGVRKHIGMVFQQFNLLNSKTVRQNVAIPLVLEKKPKAETEKRVRELLRFVELEEKKDVYAENLSGGQKQRVGIARALATSPSILLCDEATSALDPKTTESILQLLKKVNRELGVTILLITHQMNVIKEICNRVAVMESGEIVEQGNVLDVFGNPQHDITKGFVKTVIDDTVPESIRKSILEDNRQGKILRLKFTGISAQDSLLSRIDKTFNVETAILSATVSELQGTVLSILKVRLTGRNDEIAKAEQYIEKSGVEVKEVTLE
ncbi:methionine ABC transporter ATP-binding protein [Caproicibacter sp. BJN0012]|uniref:methionine ABC transporter ATP-binding protein n=1 Tax=Caproicibacter sp. BJN0012 TaxID=3110227 RepID=UPI002E124C73|nr:ATP-binding cassette domain-containing protein [Caproicibacter sp. BJN0012]